MIYEIVRTVVDKMGALKVGERATSQLFYELNKAYWWSCEYNNVGYLKVEVRETHETKT